MIDKTMPEYIFACRDTVVDAWGGTVEEGWHTAPQFDEEVEYIRADLVTGDAKEPLKYGQYRWVKLKDATEGEGSTDWQIVRVDVDEDERWNEVFVFISTHGLQYWEDDIELIGPVIRPSEGR